MKKEKRQFREKKLPVLIIGVLTALLIVYIGFAIFFRTHFCFGTTIDGISAGGKSVQKMEQLIAKEIENYTLTLDGRENMQETISGNSISILPVFDGEVEALLEQQNGFAWAAALFTKPQLEMEQAVTFDEQALEQVIGRLNCLQPSNQRKPVNAAVSSYTKDGYELIPADYGTTIDKTKLLNAVKESVSVLSDTLDLEKTDCYVKPQVEDDDETLLAAIEKMNRYTQTTVTYDFETAKEVLDGSVISTWLSVDDAHNVIVDEDGVLSFVKELAKEYNTCYKPKNFKTSYGATVTISNGPYGWKIDNAGEKAQILADLESGDSIEREPVYTQTANSHGENDYGDSYVEINLTAQHLFLYKNGELITESDFVSGNLAKGYGTPGGAFLLTYKTMDAVLRGENYATPVKYWMPFNGNIGMHDLTSRKAFGGDIYKTRGSHGCINLPYSAAQKIYENIEQGYCVMVYELPGTESDAVKQKEAAQIVNIINSIGPVTLLSEPVIQSARTAYDALPDDAKSYVSNYQTLVDAEAALALLKSAAPADTAPTDTAPADAAQTAGETASQTAETVQ